MFVLVTIVFAGISNAEVNAQDNNFIKNEEKVDDLYAGVIYRLDGFC